MYPLAKDAVGASGGAGPPMKGFGGGNYSAAWDGDVRTFYDYSKANGGWTEASILDTSGATITHIEYYPRAGYLARHIRGGKFVGNQADKNQIPLGTIETTPTLGWNAVTVPMPEGGKEAPAGQVASVEFVAADGSYGNIAEIMLYQRCGGGM